MANRLKSFSKNINCKNNKLEENIEDIELVKISFSDKNLEREKERENKLAEQKCPISNLTSNYNSNYNSIESFIIGC